MEDNLSSTNYMGKPVFSEAMEDDHGEDDDTFSLDDQESGWDLLVDLIASYENSMPFSAAYETSSSIVCDDEDLEDTASSPMQSPKLADLDYLYTKSKETYSMQHCVVKSSAMEAREVGVGFLETELRRRGLCLVPISMLHSPYIS